MYGDVKVCEMGIPLFVEQDVVGLKVPVGGFNKALAESGKTDRCMMPIS